MGLMTMTDLSFTVHFGRWKYAYSFSRTGTVSWRDVFNGQHGNGSWRIKGSEMIVSWPSGSYDIWELPINPKSVIGTAYLKGEGTFDLWAEAQNYYVRPGDVLTVGKTKYVVYEDEIRSGGTVAWIGMATNSARIKVRSSTPPRSGRSQSFPTRR
jgi:hypothetical protein